MTLSDLPAEDFEASDTEVIELRTDWACLASECIFFCASKCPNLDETELVVEIESIELAGVILSTLVGIGGLGVFTYGSAL